MIVRSHLNDPVIKKKQIRSLIDKMNDQIKSSIFRPGKSWVSLLVNEYHKFAIALPTRKIRKISIMLTFSTVCIHKAALLIALNYI
jgi:hypothetical protein